MLGLAIRRRFLHTSCQLRTVRVRFAPSPTGYIHLGGLRTALYNFLYARSHGGKFILRIEDTDRKRLIQGAAVQLEADLDWIGLSPDESPLKGGSFGPYTQSERLPLYQHHVQELVDSGHAYPCFCTDRRLECVKKQAIREGAIPRYDNRCRHLSNAQIEEKKRQGMAHCIRFKLGPLENPIQDMVYGDIDRTAVQTEGDPVILKQDGFPTYHLANVVDDHLMEITHVLRGTEWLVSTPKHILLYRAFNWQPPEFAHLPLIMNADGTKLSKRQDDIRLDFFRAQGYYPESIVGLLCLVGGGFASTDVHQNVLTLASLAKLFNLGKVTTHSGRLDMARLEQFNRFAFQNRIAEPDSTDKIVNQLSELVKASIPEDLRDNDILVRDNLVKILHWAAREGRIHLLQQLVGPDMGFLWSRPQRAFATSVDAAKARLLIKNLVDWLQNRQNTNRNEVTLVLKQMASESNVKFGDFMKLMRNSLTGLKEGPSVGEIFEILGPRVCARRLENSLHLLQ